MIVINDNIIQSVQDPYLSVSHIIDVANRRIRNSGYTKIPDNMVLEILRLTLNEISMHVNISRNSQTLTLLNNENFYILDIPNLKSLVKVFDEQYTYNFISEKEFDYLTGNEDYKYYTLKQTDSTYFALWINPTPSTSREIQIYYYTAGNEAISINSYLEFPNQLYTFLLDCFIYRLIEDLDSDDPIKQNELSYYYTKYQSAIKMFSKKHDGNDNSVITIKYNRFKFDPDKISLE